ncbi:MAG TPA: hypothetical protein VLQ52_03860 [Coriobacteriia bacterium]|nr:hypothetical protein [Coriobacteriia bacterium]
MVRRILIMLALAVTLLALPACDDADPAILEEELAESLETTVEATAPEDLAPAALLTPADVEAVSGLTGLTTVPYAPETGAGGDVNIADGNGQLVAMLVVEGLETWDAWKTDGTTFSTEYTPTIGDESYTGPTGSTSGTTYIIGFRKGETAIVIDTYFAPGSAETILSVDELAELARIVESRL